MADASAPDKKAAAPRDDRSEGAWSRERSEGERLAAGLPPLLVEAERVAGTIVHGVHGRRRAGMGETFWQFRRYQQGDSATSVDWRQSARTDRLYVRENEWEAAQSVFLWCDTSPSMEYRSDLARETKARRAVVLTLALASLLTQAGEKIALIGSGMAPATGRVAMRRLTHHLLGGEALTVDLPRPEPLPRFARAVLVGDFFTPSEDTAACLKAIGARGVHGHMLQVVDPAEEDLPFRGRTVFEGLDVGLSTTIGRAESIRGDYRKRLAAHRSALERAAKRLGWTFAVHRTDRPAQQALLALYHALQSPAPH